MNDNIDKATFANSLSEARNRRGFTQSDLAERVGVTLRHYKYFESPLSRTLPSIGVLVRLADELRVSLDSLLNRKNPPSVR